MINDVPPSSKSTHLRSRARFGVLAVRCLALSSLLLFPSSLVASEKKDVLVMRNGDHITCEVKGLSAGVLSIKLSYVQGTIDVQWSEVDRLESNQVFLVKTETGAVYTGRLLPASVSGDRAVKIEIATVPESAVEVPRSQIVKLNQSAESFPRRFNGAINTGILYSKGNQSTQFNLSSQVEYLRERWSSQASFDSSFAASRGDNVSTRNQVNLSGMRLLPWNKWFYSGSGTFLQSSVQGIDLQTTLGGGIGHYLRNSNRATVYVLGGIAWQNARYGSVPPGQGAQNTAAALVASEVKVFRFKKTNLGLSAAILPDLSGPERVRATTNATYYVKIVSDLSWNFSFYGNWDSRPPQTLSGSDYGTSSGLSWTFGDR